MKLRNALTGDTVEVPPPDHLGQSVVRFNGRVVEHVLYSDEDGGTATTEDARVFTSDEWGKYIARKMKSGDWSDVNHD